MVNEVLRLSDPYTPKAKGDLIGSGHPEDGTDIVWNMPYAHYMWEGIVYEDPQLHCAGFKTENGWRSRKESENVPPKVPTDRKLEYGNGGLQNGGLRGDHWVERMLQDGGLEEIEKGARREAGK